MAKLGKLENMVEKIVRKLIRKIMRIEENNEIF